MARLLELDAGWQAELASGPGRRRKVRARRIKVAAPSLSLPTKAACVGVLPGYVTDASAFHGAVIGGPEASEVVWWT